MLSPAILPNHLLTGDFLIKCLEKRKVNMDGILFFPEAISTKTFVIVYNFFLMYLKIHKLAMINKW